MRIKQFISRIVMALIITFGVQTTASAQFGSLKGLANKAKKAVKDKAKETVSDAKKGSTTTVQQQAETTVSATATNVTGAWEWENKHPENNDRVDYSIARQTEWTVESDINDICADLAWNLKNIYRLENYLNVMRTTRPTTRC